MEWQIWGSGDDGGGGAADWLRGVGKACGAGDGGWGGRCSSRVVKQVGRMTEAAYGGDWQWIQREIRS